MTEPPQAGRVHPTRAGLLIALGLLGLVLGWSVRFVAEHAGGTAPLVTWGPAIAMALVAVVLGWTARVTARQIRLRRFLPPHQAVNRLVLAKASALVGSVVGGGYAGYALSWLGADAEMADQRAWRSVAAALAAGAAVAGSLWLERACRVRNDDPTT